MATDKRTSIRDIHSDQCEQVFITATIDARRGQLDTGVSIPICIRVTYQRERKYFATGIKVSKSEEYNKYGRMMRQTEPKKSIMSFFDRIKNAVRELQERNEFSLTALQEELGKKKLEKKMLFEYWESFAESKEKEKTKMMYKNALSKFKKFHPKDMPLKSLTTGDIEKWKNDIIDSGCSNDTVAIYLRALRGMLNHAVKEGLLKTAPKIEMPGNLNRRDENYIHVEEILRLWDYWKSLPEEEKKVGSGWAVGMWLTEYCINGANSIDLAKLKWTQEYRKMYPEFKFERSKMDRVQNKPKQKTIMYAPIIPQLQELIDIYASEYEDGKLVFPFIFGEAKTDSQKSERVNGFNRKIAKLIAPICDALGIRKITPQYCRNSYITALAHAGVPSFYIDWAVGHVQGILGGYIAKYDDCRRRQIQSNIFKVNNNAYLNEE